MTYEEFYKQVESVVKTHYSEVGIANGVIAVLEKFRLDEEAAQQKSVQRTDGRLTIFRRKKNKKT